MPRFHFRQFALFLLAAATLSVTGCDPAHMGAFRGVAEKYGAKVVNKSSDDDIREMFSKTNDQCPIKMDAYTTLERVTMLDDKNIEFYYKVNDKGRRLVKGLSKERMRKNAVQHMKGNAMAVAVAERDLSIIHVYEDKFGGHILSYTINKSVLNGQEPIGEQKGNPFAVTPVKAKPTVKATEKVAEKVDDQSGESEPVGEETEEPVKAAPELESNPEPEPVDLLPQQYKPQKRTRENPAGVRANPFYQ